ncbi:hypothetical protein QKU48_gp1323 [Fadolivirus algeromassiliense]|jgi:hypothetical protein|uniref:Uncharacterized protein n=1 Tax=Fadolivirus FV1/VV64 TaxID=3070911 RepID=A0A7D3R222_9VIRU|nr:hypothetical protein QKU48_gp1323 [Fadolivirus algeromassiliense]QKF94781.1 hypothetical protein Fadolivirus_1_1323 [Fadolivirus FV1/VV64]
MSTKKTIKPNTKNNFDNNIPDNNIPDNNVVDNVVPKAAPDSNKYKIALKLVNLILVNIGKEEVDDLTKFKDIDREDIIKDVNKKSLQDMESELFPLFNKKKVGYYRKTDGLVLNCLRGMMKDIGFEMHKVQKGKMVIFDGKSYEKTCMIYCIR